VNRTVADVGEDALLAEIFPVLPLGSATILGPGDDAAVLAAPDARVVVSTDVLVEGRHFQRDWGTGVDVGWRAAVQNLADVAAMGARPTALVVGLVLPGDIEVSWVLDLARGLAAASEPHGVGVVGGDLSGGEEIVIAVTVLGDLGGRAPVRRDGARPGDVVALVGTLGRAAAGLAVLESGAAPSADSASVESVVASFLRPTPPVGLGTVAADAGARAMIDLSDGLLRDSGRVARASGVAIDIDSEAVRRLAEPLGAAADLLGVDPLAWALTGGEDHGLLACFAAGTTLPAGFTAVGRVVEAEGEPRALVDGEPWSGSPGFDHFGGS